MNPVPLRHEYQDYAELGSGVMRRWNLPGACYGGRLHGISPGVPVYSSPWVAVAPAALPHQLGVMLWLVSARPSQPWHICSSQWRQMKGGSEKPRVSEKALSEQITAAAWTLDAENRVSSKYKFNRGQFVPSSQINSLLQCLSHNKAQQPLDYN